MGVGQAAAGKGQGRRGRAQVAVASPLMETSINGAHGVLINITGSEDMDLGGRRDRREPCSREAAHPDANIIFGATFDENMDDEIRVTVIATGFDDGTCRLRRYYREERFCVRSGASSAVNKASSPGAVHRRC